MLTNVNVQKSGDPYGTHIGQITDWFSNCFSVSKKSIYPDFIPLAQTSETPFYGVVLEKHTVHKSPALVVGRSIGQVLD